MSHLSSHRMCAVQRVELPVNKNQMLFQGQKKKHLDVVELLKNTHTHTDKERLCFLVQQKQTVGAGQLSRHYIILPRQHR